MPSTVIAGTTLEDLSVILSWVRSFVLVGFFGLLFLHLSQLFCEFTEQVVVAWLMWI